MKTKNSHLLPYYFLFTVFSTVMSTADIMPAGFVCNRLFQVNRH